MVVYGYLCYYLNNGRHWIFFNKQSDFYYIKDTRHHPLLIAKSQEKDSCFNNC